MTILFLSLLLLSSSAPTQRITASELLQRSITYHDPQGNWPSIEAIFTLHTTMADSSVRYSAIVINKRLDFFSQERFANGSFTYRAYQSGKTQHMLNGNPSVSPEQAQEYRLTPEGTSMYRNYYLYLFGIPMKLADPGTHIDSDVERVTFKGQQNLRMRITYDPEVGGDTWYFYFHPKTYALQACQFFHDEAENDGEYILFTGEIPCRGILFPQTRKWYYNKSDSFLATDHLTSVQPLH